MQIFCKFFSIFLLKCRLVCFAAGGGGFCVFLFVRSHFDTPTAAGVFSDFARTSIHRRRRESSPKRCPPHREGGGGWRVWLRRWRDGAFLGVFWGVFPWGVELPPRSGVYPQNGAFLAFFGGVFLYCCKYLYKKNTGVKGGNHTGGDVGGILARIGGNREVLIFVVQVSKHTNAQLKGVLCVFKSF